CCALRLKWHTATTLIMTLAGTPMNSDKLKVTVIGTGSLGKEHARIYSELASSGTVDFVGVYDMVPDTARKVAERHGITMFSSVPEAIAACDAASVVTPTATHLHVTRQLPPALKHALLEKPMT